MMLTGIISAPNPYVVARTLASRGLAVFPVRAKRPLTPKGVYSATCDLDLLARLNWSGADGCGLATGKASGVDVLDVDVRGAEAAPRMARSSPRPHGADAVDAGGDGVDGLAVLAQMGALPETLTASTPSGGRHFYFRHIAGARSRKLCADGSVEWFSTGKLVVVPPAPGRTWLNQAEIVEAPDWLKAMVLAPKHGNAQGAEGGGTSGPLVAGRVPNTQVPREIYLLIVRGMRGAEPSVQRRVRGLWANLAAKGARRNDGLNYTAWQYSIFIECGDLNREIAAKLLWRACEANGYLAKDGAGVVKEVITRVLDLVEWPTVPRRKRIAEIVIAKGRR
jgi:hypothetical protein